MNAVTSFPLLGLTPERLDFVPFSRASGRFRGSPGALWVPPMGPTEKTDSGGSLAASLYKKIGGCVRIFSRERLA
jgi:hypothetical protein